MELVSGMLCCADEYQISHVKPVCFDLFVGSLHVPVLILAENFRDVIPVIQKPSYELPGLLFHYALGYCKLPDVVIESVVVAVGEVVLRKVGFHQVRVVYCHLHDVQDVDPIYLLV